MDCYARHLFALVMLVLSGLTATLEVKAQAPCTYTPSNISLSYGVGGISGFGGPSYAPVSYTVNGTQNGAPRWTSSPSYFAAPSYNIVWSSANSRWEIIDANYNNYLIAHTTTGSITNLPCSSSGWVIDDADDVGYAESINLTGGCGSLVPPSLTVTATPSLTIGGGSSVTLSASGASSYHWSTGDQTASTIDTPTSTTAYSVTGITASNCSLTATATVTVQVSALTLVTSAMPATLCAGSVTSLTVAVTGGIKPYSYTWVAPAGVLLSATSTSVVSATATTSGVKTLTITVAGTGGVPVSTSTVAITVNSSPTVSIEASSTSLSGGQSATLTASGANSYTWNTPSNATAITVSPVTTTVYSVSGSQNGCVGEANITVSVNCVAPIAKAISVTMTSVLGPGNCTVSLQGQGTGTSFVVTGPGGYVFSNVYRRVGTYSLSAMGVTKPGTYTLTAKAANACGQESVDTYTYIVTGTACP